MECQKHGNFHISHTCKGNETLEILKDVRNPSGAIKSVVLSMENSGFFLLSCFCNGSFHLSANDTLLCHLTLFQESFVTVQSNCIMMWRGAARAFSVCDQECECVLYGTIRQLQAWEKSTRAGQREEQRSDTGKVLPDTTISTV